MTSNCIYYVYQYIDPTTKIPFYVGYGQKNRKLDHLRPNSLKKNSAKNNKIKKLLRENVSPAIEIVKDNLSKNDAQELEKKLIHEIGRLVLNTGPLTNITNGGDGGDTLSNHPNIKDIMKRAGESRKITMNEFGYVNPATRPEVRKKISDGNKGKTRKHKISNYSQGRHNGSSKPILLISDTIILEFDTLLDFCKNFSCTKGLPDLAAKRRKSNGSIFRWRKWNLVAD